MAIEKQRVHFTRDSVTASSLPFTRRDNINKAVGDGLSLWKKALRCLTYSQSWPVNQPKDR
jgi:hypothetical protein